MWLSDYNNITGYEQTGCTLSMFANRLSFFFDFKGPSKAVDTGETRKSNTYSLHALLLLMSSPCNLLSTVQHVTTPNGR